MGSDIRGFQDPASETEEDMMISRDRMIDQMSINHPFSMTLHIKRRFFPFVWYIISICSDTTDDKGNNKE